MLIKKHYVYFDGGHQELTSAHREHRKLSVAAMYTLSRREMEAKVLDIADVLLAVAEKRAGRDRHIHK